MKFSVLINNYNYGRFLVECVESVMGQSHPAHEIIVVDDGSTDDSLEILREHYGGNPRVKIISQVNQGQTAAIASGIEAATGEIVCLLDADDRYKPEYLATLEAHYTNFPKTDVTFCRYEAFGQGTLPKNENIWLNPQRDYDYGYTALLCYFGNLRWIGNTASTVALRLRLARAINLSEVVRTLYVPVQAEFSILLPASLLGGRKYYLHRALTEYRRHETNDSTTVASSHAGHHMFWFGNLVRYEYFKRRSSISEDLFKWLDSEANTVPDPLPGHLEYYRHIKLSRMAPPKKISWARELERKLRNARKGLWGKAPAGP